MRHASTYRAEKRKRARRLKLIWRAIPREAVGVPGRRGTLVVRVPGEQAHPKRAKAKAGG